MGRSSAYTRFNIEGVGGYRIMFDRGHAYWGALQVVVSRGAKLVFADSGIAIFGVKGDKWASWKHVGTFGNHGDQARGARGLCS